jgi:hypothetical protein
MRNEELVLLNLKIIASIPEDHKLIMTGDNVVKFLKTNYTTSLYRFILRESRETTIKHIADIIDSVYDYVLSIVNSKFYKYSLKSSLEESFLLEKLSDEVSKNIAKLALIKNELMKLDSSFENLKKTYINDTTTIQKINSLLDRKNMILLTIDNSEKNKNKK